MEINYDTILKYLYKETEISSVEKKINIIEKITNEHFKDIFDDSFFKYGVYKTDNDGNNISLITSFIYCLDEKFINYTFEDINNIVSYYKTELGELSIDNIVKIFDVNYIIFNFQLGDITSLYNTEYFNPWKPTMLLAYDGIYYEPIICNDTNIFSYSNAKSTIFINNILCNDIQYHNSAKDFFINDNFIEVLENDNLVNTVSDTFTTTFDISKDITLNKLNKMKKADIMTLIDELNLTIMSLKPTKKDLINMICSNYNIK